MTQQELFTTYRPLPMPAARMTDPQTSKAAAMSARELAAHHVEIILEALRSHGPSGKDRIAALTRLTGTQVARRTCEMHRAGLIEPTGNTVLSASGRAEREWRSVE